MEFEYYSDDYRPLNKGDMYFTPDGTAFIKADVDIPKELQGKELWFSLKTAAEICVKVNGKYVGGVDLTEKECFFLLTLTILKLFILK